MFKYISSCMNTNEKISAMKTNLEFYQRQFIDRITFNQYKRYTRICKSRYMMYLSRSELNSITRNSYLVNIWEQSQMLVKELNTLQGKVSNYKSDLNNIYYPDFNSGSKASSNNNHSNAIILPFKKPA